jgi:hypothetical protein
MSPLEYLLFGINMIFLIDYTFGQAEAVDIFDHYPRDALPSPHNFASEERALALQLMAMIDQLLLFFYALKVCLTFS